MADARLELLADSSQIRTATSDLDKLTTAGGRAEKSTKAMKSELDTAARAQAAFSRKVSQSSIQLEQFFGQVSGGGNVIQAASYQLADLGIVLGNALPFALGAIALSIGNLVLPTEESVGALERLDEIAETVGNTLEQAADGSDVFSESIQRLATRSEALARVQIAQTIADINEQIAASARGIREAISEFDGIRMDVGVVDTLQELGLQLEDVPRLFGDISSEVDALGSGGVLTIRGITERIDLLANSLGISREQATSLQVAIDDFAKDQSATGIARLRGEIESLTTEVGADNEKLTKLSSSLLAFFESSRTGVDRVNLLRQALADLNGTLESNSEDSEGASKSAQKLTTNLQAQVIALEAGSQAAEVYAATQAAIANGTQEQLPEIIALINRKYELKRAQEEAAATAKAEAAAQRELESDYEVFLRRLKEGEELKAKLLEQDKARFANLKQEIILQQSSLGLTSNELELKRNLLALGADDGSELYQQRAAEITQLTTQLQAMRFEAELIGTSLNESLGNIGLSALDSVSQGLASVISQGESAREVFHEIANTILNELLTAMIRYFIGQAAQSILSTTTVAGAQVAAAGTVAAAWTPAAIAASIATAGGATTAGVGAITAGAPIAAGALAATSLAGFESGGYTGNYGTSEVAGVVHGREFVVNAQNTAKNRATLEAMNRGESVGGDTYVNVINNSSNTTVGTQESTNSDGAKVIDIVVADINRRGRIHQSMVRTTTADNKL